MSELATTSPNTGALGVYEPQNAEQAMAIARWISQSGLLGKVPPKPETVFFLMATGHELGLSVAQSLRAMNIIDGKPALTAQAMVAIVRSSPVCEYFRLIESTDESATWVTKRRGNPEQSFTFTAAMARERRLILSDQEREEQFQRKVAIFKKKGWDPPTKEPTPWDTMRALMIRKTGSTELIKIEYQDLILGLKTPEEIVEEAKAEGRVIDIGPDGEVVPDDPEVTRSRAGHAQVKQDLQAVREGDSEQVRQRFAAEDEAAAAAPKFTGSSAEEAINPPRSPQATGATGLPDIPEVEGAGASSSDHRPAAPEAGSASEAGPDDRREVLASAIEAFSVDQRKDFFASLKPPMSYQAPTIIRTRLSIELVDRLLLALKPFQEAQLTGEGASG